MRHTVLVNGGAQGLGAATALNLAKRGCRLMIADIDQHKAEAIAARCDQMGSDSAAIPIDLSRASAGQQVVDQAMAAAGRLDVVINCAAIAPVESFVEMTDAGWEMALLINVRSVAMTMAAAGRAMMDQRSGHIINVTSAAARMALPNYAAYAATKAAVDSLTRSGAVALGPYGIRVNAFSPGMMDTLLQDHSEAKFCKLEGRDDLAAFKAERTARIPLGRRSTPEEMAESLTWLALDSPAYMTAERFNVTGGLDKD